MHFEPRFRTLVDILQQSTKAHASRPLFGTKKRTDKGDSKSPGSQNTGSWEWMTFAEFGREVDRLRAGLASRGVLPR